MTAAAAANQGHFASASLYVGDLSKDVSEAGLYEVFNTVGPVASIRVCRDSTTRRSLGYAYVNYHSVGDAERALDTLNYAQVKNAPCRIMWSHRDPALRKSGAGNIFVKNLDKTIDSKALYDTFSLFGNILSCKVATDEKGNSRGFGFVHYETEKAAQTAIERVNGMKINHKTVFVGQFKRRGGRVSQQDEKFTNLYVKNIPNSWDEEKVKALFSQHGEVSSLKLQEDARGRKTAFVNFASVESAKAAVENLHDMKVVDDEPAAAASDENSGEKKKEKETTEDGETTSGDAEGDKKESSADGDKADAEESADGAAKATDTTTAEGADGADGENVGDGSSSKKTDGTTSAEDDKRLFVSRFQSKAERAALLKSKFEQSDRRRRYGVNLYIKNIADTVDDAGLRELFEPFGVITSAKIMLDYSGRSRGFGFVSFITPDEATKAVTEMHLSLVHGKPLYVGLHEPRAERYQRLKMRLPGLRNRGPAGVLPHYPNHFAGGQQPHHHMGYSSGGGPAASMANSASYMGGGRGAGGPMGSGGGYPPHSQQPGGGFSGSGGPVSWGRGQPMRGPGYPTHGPPPHSFPQGGAPQPGGAGAFAMGPPPQGSGVYPPQGASPSGDPNGPGGIWAQGGVPMAGTPGGGPVPGGRGGVPMDMPPMDVQGAGAMAATSAEMHKQMLGERLFPQIRRWQPQLAGKITGMFLDMDNAELHKLLSSPDLLKAKVDEALRVLHQAQAVPASALIGADQQPQQTQMPAPESAAAPPAGTVPPA